MRRTVYLRIPARISTHANVVKKKESLKFRAVHYTIIMPKLNVRKWDRCVASINELWFESKQGFILG